MVQRLSCIPSLEVLRKYYRLLFDHGACSVEPGDGEAVAAMQLKWKDALKLFSGKMDPMVAIMTGKIKIKGDARAFMVFQDLK